MSVQPAKAPSHLLPCPVVGRGGYNGGERAFVSFASRRLRLTIYWRRAGLVDDCIQLPYAHVMQLVRWRFWYLPHAYANLRDLPQKHRAPVSMPAYPARPLQLILTLNSLTNDPESGQVKGQLAGWMHPSYITSITRRMILALHSQLPVDTAFWTCSHCATVWRVRCLCNVSSMPASAHRMLPR